MHWRSGQSVVWRSRPGGDVGYVYAGNLIVHSDSLTAIFQPPGAPIRKRSGRRGGPRGRSMLPGGWDGRYDDLAWRGSGMTRMHPRGTDFSVLRGWLPAESQYSGWYVNLERDWWETPIGFDSRDDILDLRVADDLSTWALKDDDELRWAVEVGTVSAGEVGKIRATASAVVELVAARSWPFLEAAWEQLVPDASWPHPVLPVNWAARWHARRDGA